MRKLRLAVIAALFTCFATWADAAMVDPVSFWVYDGNHDKQISLSVQNIPLTQGVTLQYGTNNITWQEYNPSKQLIIVGSEKCQIFFRLLTDSFSPITKGNLTFSGQIDDSNFFRAASIVWGNNLDFTFTATGNDKFSSVPVPPSLYLFASALIGMVYFQRRKVKDNFA
jgi:hypothetical protein